MMIMVKEGNASRFVVEKASLRLFVDGVRLGEYDAALGDFGFPLYGRVLAGQVRIVWMESDRKEEEENIEGDRTTVCCMHKETMCDIMYIYIVTKRHRGREIERMLTVYVCVCVLRSHDSILVICVFPLFLHCCMRYWWRVVFACMCRCSTTVMTKAGRAPKWARSTQAMTHLRTANSTRQLCPSRSSSAEAVTSPRRRTMLRRQVPRQYSSWMTKWNH